MSTLSPCPADWTNPSGAPSEVWVKSFLELGIFASIAARAASSGTKPETAIDPSAPFVAVHVYGSAAGGCSADELTLYPCGASASSVVRDLKSAALDALPLMLSRVRRISTWPACR